MNWGEPPWRVDFKAETGPLPKETDIAIVGGGFTGLAAATWLRLLAPEESVTVLEAGLLGAGASGRTGGMVLAETAAGDLPGLGDVLGGFTHILEKLGVECELSLAGAWEIGRSPGLVSSPIEWQDSGTLRVVKEVPGGSLDPGRMVTGLGRAAHRLGAVIRENAPVQGFTVDDTLELKIGRRRLCAAQVLFATNALSLALSGLAGRTEPKFTLAVATEPLSEKQLKAIGLAERKPFYTVDLPYLWGRVCADNRVIFGAGLVHLTDSQEFSRINIVEGESERLLSAIYGRVRSLHPALRSVELTHRWGGPILVADSWRPVFDWHPRSHNALVLGAYAGHGVALSVYLGCWAAEVLLGHRELPPWGRLARLGADSR